MRILIVGGGGREHALAWRVSRSPLAEKVYCAPGNAGIASLARCVDLKANDVEGLLAFARKERIDLTIVGPEEPLCLGLADRFEAEGLRVFGPRRKAAEIEGSKAFCRELLHRYRIPSPAYRLFVEPRVAIAFLETHRSYPLVLKASGLAGGKGVSVVRTVEEARETVSGLMESRVLGEAGATVVCEDYLEGEEVSVLALTDGRTILPLEPAQDHKRLLEGDAGPNTGGMGAISPTPAVTPRLRHQIESQILVPTVHALNREGRRYRGVLYAGLMLTPSGPRVLEFNCRFGDPEAQAILLRLLDDPVPLFARTAEGTLEEGEGLRWDPRSAVCVVAASEGYPGTVAAGKRIEGLDRVEEGDDLRVFHAGTARGEGNCVTAGGRVLGVAALGRNCAEAAARAYEALGRLHFEGMQFRRDIGARAIDAAAAR
ncbi:MAG TPA: phosphoribosylamine--glycine ligase [Planctomycetota bacterium]|jgi:phosphoribosylamine--glycine ligase|nr:phosphoribosylamine--glycine ligase [Planctomycetota bacterium]